MRCSDSLESFIRKAKSVHGDNYDYSKVEYQKSSIKVQIICKMHGPFWQRPNAHIAKKTGCPKCAGKSLSTVDFIEKAIAVHGDKYNYEPTKYHRIKEKVAITCKKHGIYYQIAEAHLIGRGCTLCWQESYSSKGESEVAEWISSLGLDVVRNDRNVMPNGMEIDILIPSLSIGIEYNGCYWHSDRTNKAHQHAFKHQGANSNGIRLITVWDYDWKHRKDIVKRHLRHAFNLDHGRRIHARTCKIVNLPTPKASQFYEENHIQGACRGAVLHLGLEFRGELVAAMSFTIGGTRRGKTGTGEWELARYATSSMVRGGASRLFAEFLRQIKPSVVWSFSDRQHFSGGIYSVMGFKKDGDLRPDYKIVHPSTLRTWHKSLWQRKSIPKRLRDIGSEEIFDPKTDPRSERQLQDDANVLRVWDAGKIRWVWHPDQASIR
jgi:hypothetical protein